MKYEKTPRRVLKRSLRFHTSSFVTIQVVTEKQVFAPLIKGERGIRHVLGYNFSWYNAVNPPFPLYQGGECDNIQAHLNSYHTHTFFTNTPQAAQNLALISQSALQSSTNASPANAYHVQKYLSEVRRYSCRKEL
jgi:hypothetical protein